ncbi:hypothetical protein KAM462_38040 [Aeromonas caviae]|nr:hypothetical protein KAM462_38040 [Aeromonas caviae]
MDYPVDSSRLRRIFDLHANEVLMLSDIEISRQSPRLPIAEVAAQLGICLLYTSDAADE